MLPSSNTPNCKSVRFKTSPEVCPVLHVDDYTDREKSSAWWGPHDFRRMQVEAIAVVEYVRSTQVPIMSHDLEDRLAFRGLESLIEKERVNGRIQAGLNAVLSSKCLKCHVQAESYALHGALSLKEAQYQALLDELSVLVDARKEQAATSVSELSAAVLISPKRHRSCSTTQAYNPKRSAATKLPPKMTSICSASNIAGGRISLYTHSTQDPYPSSRSGIPTVGRT